MGERVIDETRAAFVSALRHGDAKAASALYADDAMLLPPSAELLHGREAIEAYWKTGVEAGISDVELEALELGRQEGIAYEVGRYVLRLQPADGEPVVDRGKYVLVHKRGTDGAWRRAVEMFSPDAFATGGSHPDGEGGDHVRHAR